MSAQTVSYDENATLKPNEYKREYTVTYNANGGTVGDTTDAYTKSTYGFIGWDANNDGVKDHNDEGSAKNWTSVDGTVYNLKALWDNQYNSGGKHAAVTLTTATRDGYEFDGWYTDSGDQGVKVGDANVSYTPTSDVTLFAHWTPVDYTIRFLNGYDGAVVGTHSYKITDTAITYPDIPTRTGYTFNNNYTYSGVTPDGKPGNWSSNDVLVNNQTVLSGKYGDVDFIAGWTPKTYTVTYKAVQPVIFAGTDYRAKFNGSPNQDVQITYTYDSTYSAAGMPALDLPAGYTFGGWYTDAACSDGNQLIAADNLGTEIVKIEAPTTLYPKWEPITYHITYDLNDGGDQNTVFTADNPQEYTILTGADPSDPFNIPTATRTGYGDIAQWKVVSDVSDTPWAAGEYVYAGEGRYLAMFGDVTVRAEWQPAEVYVVYAGLEDGKAVDALGQQVTDSKTDYNSPLGTLATGVRDGYTFGGWYLTPECAGQALTPESVYNGANGFAAVSPYRTNVYAKWTANTYTVTFNGNGSTSGSMDAQAFTYDAAAKALSSNNFGRTGYDLAGWSLDPAAETASWTDGQEIQINGLLTAEQKQTDNATVTLYAVWTKHPYKVTWKNYDNSVIDETYVLYQDSPVHADASFDDAEYTYTFTGWLRGDSSVNLAEEHITAPTTYKAAYTRAAKPYNVIYFSDGGQLLYTDTFSFGAATTVRDVPEKTGYNGSWVVQSPTGLTGIPASMPAYSITVKAVYTPKNYTITWDLGGGHTEPQTCAYDSVPVFSGTPTRDDDNMYKNYVFVGWAATDGGAVLESIPAVTGDATYYAVYTKEAVVYHITWRQNFVDAEHNINHHVEDIVTNVPYGSAVTEIPALTPVDGCAVAWDTAAIPAVMPAENRIVNAVYRYGARTVYWHNGDVVTSSILMDGDTVAYNGESPVKQSTPEYSYSFLGWAQSENGSPVNLSGITVNGADLHFYAVFEQSAREYTVYYYVDGGIWKQETVAYGEVIPTYSVPAKEGYTGSWSAIPETMPASDVTITASYAIRSYQVVWYVGGNVTTTSVEYGATPVFTGSTDKAPDAQYTYSFKGWATVPEADASTVIYTAENIPAMGAADIEYYAQFDKTLNSYTVTWRIGDDTVTETYDYGVVPTAPANTALPSDAQYDYTFTGWNKEIVAVTGNTTYIAQYDKAIKSYTVTWNVTDSQGNVTSTQQSVEYGRYPVYPGENPADYEDEGYDYFFAGWALTPGGEAEDLDYVTGAVEYYSAYEKLAKEFYIEWIVDGEVFQYGYYTYGAIFPDVGVPEKEGYSGTWDKAANYSTVPSHDVTLTAQYKARKYTVYWKFMENGSWKTVSQLLSFGAEIPEVAIPAREGYDAVWDNADVTTVPAGGVTFTAEYTVRTYTLTWKNDDNVSGTASATYRTEVTVTVTEPRPAEMTVYIGSALATAGTEYSYDASTGVLTVYAPFVKADILAYSSARGNSYNVSVNITGAQVITSQTTVEDGGTYYARIVAPDGFLVPTEITVYVDGVEITSGFEYLVEPDMKTARLAIDGSAVTGTVTVEAETVVDPDYDPNPQTPDDSGNSGSHSSTGDCPYCHKTHTGIIGAIIGFFHRLIYIFKSIFG